ncbi:hypothetical protein CLV30_105248 [Haloactinopolyspora alba]|uniref:NAD(+)--protein-arginine ADP-ribosyltransferase n=1 Tax=Haloactinopolyspora alba TaxID=648780 RepID=A0A2P8E5Q1_9ACTN|nr:hypothetical protein [Haloactinopolyspora alba]PSL04781.1 hypothetical protein CLV30_105248 [Haloactinopolyspora alba]
MTEPSASTLLAALEKLPATAAVTYHGLPAGAEAPTGTFVTQGFTATSRDPRVGTENFTAAELVAIAGRTGRDIAFMSQHSAEAEVVLLPGTILRPLRTLRTADGLAVHVLEELLTGDESGRPHPSLPRSADALADLVTGTVAAAQDQALPVQVSSPGKFCAALA